MITECNQKTFTCTVPECKKLFKTKFSLSRHLLTHTQDKKHECQECNKKFTLLQHLTEHMNTHTNQRPFVCGVDGCLRRFTQSGKLSLHRRTHPSYAVKKYETNSRLNSKRPLTLGDSDAERLTPVEEVKRDQEMETFVENGKHSSEKKADPVTANERSYMRQESGQTVSSTAEREGRKSEVTLLKSKASEDFCSPMRLTKEALELHDKAVEAEASSNPFIRYLECLESSIPIFLRPALPLPQQLHQNKSSNETVCAKVNLFELTNKYTL